MSTMCLAKLVALSCALSLLPGAVPETDSDACDCGPGSSGCEIENNEKVCDCDYLYRQENGVCKAFCEKDWQCRNGGTCVNGSCECLDGTSGDFCKTIDECVGLKGPFMCGDPDEVFCDFNTKTREPYCHCRIYEYMYYKKERTCVECDCGELGTCYLVEGKKTCECNEGTALSQGYYSSTLTCKECKCENSIGCTFEDFRFLTCDCPKGFAQRSDYGGYACKECDCGPHGQCYFIGWSRHCNCSKGYQSFLNINRTEITCKACDCGVNGRCYFKDEVKICDCNKGYAVQDDVCSGNLNILIELPSLTKQLRFLQNFHRLLALYCLVENNTSRDTDECKSNLSSCPNTTYCVNTMGSYECVCKEGYAPVRTISDPKVDGCQDIDECLNEDLCPRNHTICINLPGSYSCTCEKGFVPVTMPYSLRSAGCEVEEQTITADELSFWRIGFIILCVIIVILILGILTVHFKRRSALKVSHKTDTPLQNLREAY